MGHSSQYIFNHSENAKELFEENFLVTKLDGQAINPKDKKLPVIAQKELAGDKFLFLSFPYNKDNIRKITLQKDDITDTKGNVTVVATSKKQLGIYLNDSEKGFIIVENLKLTDLINYIKLDDDGNIYILLESNKESYKT